MRDFKPSRTGSQTQRGRDFFFFFFPRYTNTVVATAFFEAAPSVVHTHTHLVVILAGHDVGKGDLGFEHLATVHELHQQVAHGLELHPLGRLDVGQNETRKDLERQGGEMQR